MPAPTPPCARRPNGQGRPPALGDAVARAARQPAASAAPARACRAAVGATRGLRTVARGRDEIARHVASGSSASAGHPPTGARRVAPPPGGRSVRRCRDPEDAGGARRRGDARARDPASATAHQRGAPGAPAHGAFAPRDRPGGRLPGPRAPPADRVTGGRSSGGDPGLLSVDRGRARHARRATAGARDPRGRHACRAGRLPAW